MKPRKVSSKRLASIAGKVLEAAQGLGKGVMVWDTKELVALAASVLSQAEAPKRRAKKVRK